MSKEVKKIFEQTSKDQIKVFSEVLKIEEKLRSGTLDRAEYERKYKEWATKLRAYKEKINRYNHMPLTDEEDINDRKQLLEKLVQLIEEYKKYDPSNITLGEVKKINTAPKTWFLELSLKNSEIQKLRVEEYVCYSVKWHRYFKADLAGTKYILRIRMDKSSEDIALLQLDKTSESDDLISKVVSAERIHSFKAVKISDSRSLYTLWRASNLTTSDLEDTRLLKDIGYLVGWSTENLDKKSKK